jgi:YbgC/YbaW family acyl-CoA thioester hydrolase
MRGAHVFTTEFTIEWGDCDEAGIVFYPNYFYWFDCTFQRLLRDRGLSQRELKRRFGAVTPLVDVGARFRAPARYDDVTSVHALVEIWEERRFRVAYRLSVGGTPIVDGFEVRAWALVDQDGGIRGAPIDETFRNLLS